MHMIIHIATLEAKVALVASGVDNHGRLNLPEGDSRIALTVTLVVVGRPAGYTTTTVSTLPAEREFV